MLRLDKKTIFLSSVVVMASVLTTACTDQETSFLLDTDQTTGRWYSEQQVSLGNQVYDANCIDCHNPKARGTFKWKQPLEDGTYPPPPLNGSAHAWHHPMRVLIKTIDSGGLEMGGTMPPFKDVLNDNQTIAVIAYFQSFWNDDIYSNWLKRNQSK